VYLVRYGPSHANLEFELTAKNDRIAALEAEVKRLTKTKKNERLYLTPVKDSCAYQKL
jgi:hypothetical protein